MKKLFIAPIFLFSFLLSAQTHKVSAKETLYSISKKYGMSLQELYRLNPNLKDGKLQIGDVLKVSKNVVVQKQPQSYDTKTSGKYGKIVLEPKQTLYGISRQYHISIDDLKKLNPNLEMKIGEEVVLPEALIRKYGNMQPAENHITAAKEESPTQKTDTQKAGDTYTVQPHDNYYRLTKRFNISKKELFLLNPSLEERGLRQGDVIRILRSDDNAIDTNIPKSESLKRNSDNVEMTKPEASDNTHGDNDNYLTYTVQQGDTIFGIINRFGITLDQLVALNSKLESGLKSGMILRIRKLDSSPYLKKGDNGLNVVLMLPFGFDEGEFKYRNLALDFLLGAKLAVEMNVKKGLPINLNVIDAGDERTFKKSLRQINPADTDLIVGPLFKSNVIEVLDYVKGSNTPVVAPFANSEDMYGYGNLIIVETDKKIYAQRIAKEIKDIYSNQKIYIVSGSDKDNAQSIKQNLPDAIGAQVKIVASADEIKSEKNMMTGQNIPIIAVLASDDDSVGESFSSKVIELSKEDESLRTFSMFYTPAFDTHSGELGKVHLVYIMDRKINSGGDFEKEVLAAYKSKYCKSPSKYAVVGFDVMNDMLAREDKKGQIFKHMNKSQTELATKFEFERIKADGAYVNTGYRVVRLLP
ncbi:amino acid ABC transporter substrate-binding protein [Riemerella columbipharyngis]|uniref:ABC-type branched-chain amino acid transport system, substrate-binding protein n=1 Tax=Riemerella columbipharyngis TaxID=1071918 RepID=A0A1G7C585_9FLAO|nr:LysM peptidoglycan-binding domain-containing protein [Riemerella columbipharyngis]SDE34467.1 ABC-type branched-chain amino acid transport system, substrate-binding protein [Riemerella columbipharyngis]